MSAKSTEASRWGGSKPSQSARSVSRSKGSCGARSTARRRSTTRPRWSARSSRSTPKCQVPTTAPETTRAHRTPSTSFSAPCSTRLAKKARTPAESSTCASGWSGPQSTSGGGPPGGISGQGTPRRFDAARPLPPLGASRGGAGGRGYHPWVARTRLDAALVARGLFPSRARAQAAVLAGRVRVDGASALKPGASVPSEASLAVAPAPEYVSRGGPKLAGRLDELGLDVTGALALDLGASTGGFTDCLLRRGASRVVAVDVGYGQLDWPLRQDSRVHVLERTNARSLSPEALPFAPELVTCDLAFISVETVWPAVADCLAPGYRALVLVKPQFEAGRDAVGSGGVVRDPAVRAAAIRRVAAALEAAGGVVVGLTRAEPPGPKGNREFFLLARGPGHPARLDLQVA